MIGGGSISKVNVEVLHVKDKANRNRRPHVAGDTPEVEDGISSK